ncbi:MAG: PIN domain-containing protein, partial [Betaproteobacteria bacterium]|nr:PIN domain-containing protein [Betaproteobacteria bacterium]
MNTPVRLVLDTNVVIDWLVFDDPFMSPLREGVPAGRVQVLTHP